MTHAKLKCFSLLMAASPLVATASDANAPELEAINGLIDRYGQYQAGDAIGMSQLMAKDRVCLSQHFGGRRTDNVLNMQIQQASLDTQQSELPDIKDFVEDRERVVRLLGDGKVATVSFFRYITRVFPAGTPPALREKYATDPPLAISLVLENRDGNWIIVHTHASELSMFRQ